MTNLIENCILPFPTFPEIFYSMLEKRFDSNKFRANVYSGENGTIIDVEVPGIEKDNIEVNIDNNTITISLKNKEEKPYERKFNLNYKVDVDNVTSILKNGILRINAPKGTNSKKTIDIQIG